MTNAQAVLVRGLTKSYGGRTVVDAVDLDVPEGRVVGLIGANGAGKTTTVECVQGLRRPDKGTVRVFGLDPVAEAVRVRALIGSQLQSSALPDRLRVGEAVKLFSGRDGQELLGRFGLVERAGSPFVSLSGGERQRLFLVLALVNRPRLVVLDELNQGLDPPARRNVWAAVEQLRSDGTTVVLVTHEMDEAEHLCDQVVAMRAGHVLATGSPSELVDRYGKSAVISFRLPAGAAPAVWPERLAGLPGVSGVRAQCGRATVTGTRVAIAHVGAALVASGWVPADLSVKMPNLEEALVRLLDDATGSVAVAEAQPSAVPVRQTTQLIGAAR